MARATGWNIMIIRREARGELRCRETCPEPRRETRFANAARTLFPNQAVGWVEPPGDALPANAAPRGETHRAARHPGGFRREMPALGSFARVPRLNPPCVREPG